jgi:FkbM family methyltransferase
MNVDRIWHDGITILDKIIEKNFYDQPGRFLGIGANIGYDYAWPLLSRGWSGVYVEPDPNACTALIKNCRSFGDRVKIVNCAITGAGGIKTFFLSLKSSYNSSLDFGWLHDMLKRHHSKDGDDHDHVYPIMVNSLSFKDLINQVGNNFDIVVIDTEGYDTEIAMSVDWDQFTKCKLICVEHQFAEIDPHLPLIEHFAKFGFIFTDQDNAHAIYQKIPDHNI